MSLFLSIIQAIGALTGFNRLFADWQQRRAGAASQQAADLKLSAKVNDAEAQAAADAPKTRADLLTDLDEGKL